MRIALERRRAYLYLVREVGAFIFRNNEVFVVLTGVVKVMNEGRTLGRVRAGGCVGEECVTSECLRDEPRSLALDTCYVESGLVCYLFVLSKEGLRAFWK